MTISIRNSIKNLLSDSYNKRDMYTFAAIVTILLTIFSVLSKSMSVSAYFFLFVYLIFAQGIFTVALNNSILNKESILPNLKNDYKQIIISALKYLLGALIYSIILFVICFVLGLALIKIPILLSTIITFLAAAFAYIWIGITFSFTSTLRFRELFNIKKAYKFVSAAGKSLLMYIWKVFLFTLALLLCVLIIAAVLVIILSIICIILQFTLDVANEIGYYTGAILGGIFAATFLLFAMDITSQFYKEVIEKANKD